MSQLEIKKSKHNLYNYKLQQGTTIVEAVVAIFVLSFGVLVLMLAQINAVNTSINAANQGEVTRAVQNLVEEMRSQPKLVINEKLDANSTKIQFIGKDYSEYATTDINTCSARLNVHLINTTLNSCVINANGNVRVSWGGQSLGNNDTTDEFSYSLTAGQS
ncbi:MULTISPECIES: hypothetical protein [unclassified Snodgrassella]|uniref:type IV pilus modification PilV family protein n=1 Tax=unclassified Snodgrassella TaxID=2625236 RepID=UPI001581C76A|nr:MULTISPECIES: hypothetical protein [Snodgrassella]MBI0068685.1 hypothetical protein [Snodgrassella sp. M0110]MBI0077368.1 hypothetical protein [Snodgrassella sp. M0118]MBI0079829.1 hypothetical protein [Snodgrassella sp. M0112]NUF78338.1 hypothetical protein [Snodgrassella sp. ESL0323]